ncbi:uncharacterized protein MONBRDRAFT_22436 [Monosiga brevicollis MX1]|uniref:DUF4442 domain-containing protein n=1 Tax=Monosiga brevicollis TaxID=81824 RepID=A9UQK4_MONBE|nr:uncharacterized protein MONBRDRAFT_22436 [Monosiga brevicollis MX1]EDQ93061.1 predicted protein [Monosiga brevicollis MX1]|eukprot:XP_001742823.1 hypothetical protein [Monosiga brevicollis MX1]
MLRWALKPLDNLMLASASLIGTAMVTPRILLNLSSMPAQQALSKMEVWRACAAAPLGTYAFLGLVHAAAPYTASVQPILTRMDEVEAEGYIVEQPWLRNPFNSVHAVALTNLGEYVSGIIVTSVMEQRTLQHPDLAWRGIVTALGTTYHKKARGKIRAVATPAPLPTTVGLHDYTVCICPGTCLHVFPLLQNRLQIGSSLPRTDQVESLLYNSANELVATTTAQWTINVSEKRLKKQ